MVVAVYQLEVEKFSFRYPDEPHLTLSGIDLAVREGEFVVLCGPSGSGKSTLLRQLKRELAPAGERSGAIRYYGRSLYEYPLSELSPQIGLVLQDPDSQIVMDDVLRELAFGMENIGLKPDVMRRRAAEIAPIFGMEPWLHRRTSQLSGGQKQLLNLAAVLALQPKLVLLDEPTAQLDPVAAREFLQLLHTLNREQGLTVILSEHRLDEVVTMCDRMLVLDQGELVYGGEPRAAMRELYRSQDSRLRHFVPSIPRLALLGEGGQPAAGPDPRPEQHPNQRPDQHPDQLREQSPDGPADEPGAPRIPLTVREGRAWAAERQWAAPKDKVRLGADPEPLWTCRDIWFQYERHEPMVLKSCSLVVERGGFLALLGGNGSGKSTLLKIIAGIHRPQRGKVNWADAPGFGRRKERTERERVIGYAPQDPSAFFLHDTVEKELYHAAVRHSARDVDGRIRDMARRFGLADRLQRHPYDLSEGERQKTMLACILLSEPDVLVLDEPTKGLDPAAKADLGVLLADLHRAGRTVVTATHDLEFAAAYAERCALLFDGGIASEGEPRDFFSRNLYYTTPVNRVMRTWLPKAVLPEDVFPWE
jgi:energy-coupling factor transport system ATP-binding protein